MRRLTRHSMLYWRLLLTSPLRWVRAFRYIFRIRRRPDPPRAVFRDVSEEDWFWLHAWGRHVSATLTDYLPGWPSREIQQRFTGSAGTVTLREGFRFYQLVREMYPPEFDPGVALDFGCGWGRITRFFIRHVEPEKLIGLDTLQEAIDICQATNKWATFQRVDLTPSTGLRSSSCDIIYSYSVFSHLSESVHALWIAEFARLLRPGGLLVLTTRGRDFILECAKIRTEGQAKIATTGAMSAFHETEQWLTSYDAGEYCYDGVGGGEGLPSDAYGEACIPRKYVEANWPPTLEFLDFVDDRSRCAQNVIVVRRTG